MELNYKDMLKAMGQIEEERRIPESVVADALKEAMCKAYKKDAELQDINVEAELNDQKGTIDIYQIYNVVDEVEDDELEMSLEDARQINPEVQIGETVRRPVEITGMSRAAATLARNVIRQKIREAEKMAVYNEYVDQLNEMVLGVVESVKDKFTLVNLGKTVAMMPRSAEIPGERLVEGQRIRVVITEVNKDTKGSQVLVSRADEMLVRRLFEKEVPEIYQGIVEIKAIARDPGERTKMAVMSHNEDVDPIGACIGQRGSRVQGIIDELHGEKIDIFQWSDDITVLVRNALAPAEVQAVFPREDDQGLLVIVDEKQLSLAIGKKGKNARLAVKLCKRKIDIKTRADLEKDGKDYDQMAAEAEVRRQELLARQKEKEQERLEAEARAAEEKRMKEGEKRVQQLNEQTVDEEEEIPEDMRENLKEKIRTDMAMQTEEKPAEEAAQPAETPAAPAAAAAPAEAAAEETAAPAAAQPAAEESEKPAQAAEEEKPEKKSGHKLDLEEIAAKNEYVSRFEKLADTSKPKPQAPSHKKKRRGEEEDIKTRNKVLEQQLRKDIDTDSMKPVYTDEELDEIERQQEEEEESQYNIDYDEYEEYYDDDSGK